MLFYEHTLDLGADKPFTFLHVSDTHLTFADERDGQRKTELAARRALTFPDAEENLLSAEQKARELGCFIAHTGDLIDFVSLKNLETAKAFTDEYDCFMAAGNHEFSLYVGEAKEDAAYRAQSLDKVQSVFHNDIRFSVRLENGIKLIALDNSYYLIEQEQLAALKNELSDGVPAILFMHTPLYSPEVFDFCVETEGGVPAYLMSVPEEKMRGYSPERYEQQKEDETTARAYRYILGCDNIKAVFAGHVHHDFESFVTPSLPQYITGLGSGRIVHVR